jgi:16S rRNA (guanine527-N7)-methyltransferase
MTTLLNQVTAALRENNYDFPLETQKQFVHFLELLQKWNRVFNLTSINDPREQVYLHLLDSLSIAPYLNGQRLLDVGSGGGLPGLPLAITDPSKSWVLLDKVQKKTRFLLQTSAELSLKNVAVVCERCEAYQPETGFDSIISRAFARIKLFLETTQHLIKPQGLFLAMKGAYPEDELAELPDGFKVVDVQKLVIHGLEAERHLVRIQKIN